MGPEIREDPTTGDLVVIAADRAARPQRLQAGGQLDLDPTDCPFCPGHEHLTPPTLQAVIREGAWQARAFLNKFPGVRGEGPPARWARGPTEILEGVGVHEVLVETPEHHPPPGARGGVDALLLARDRMRALAADARLEALCWFRNHGAAAGASLGHPHAQLVALPVVPPRLAAMTDRMAAHHQAHGGDLLGELVAFERADGARMLRDQGPVVAFCPLAARVPYEIWLVPRQVGADFTEADDAQVGALAEALQAALAMLDRALGDPPYNAVLYTRPLRRPAPGFRWHLRLLPRLSRLAGFELGGGAWLHGVPPEEAAQALREGRRR